MVKYNTIIKVIEEEISKCKATLQAKNIGKTGIWGEETDENGEKIDVLTYNDGTTIKFNKDGIVDFYNESEMFYQPSHINLYDQGEQLRYIYGEKLYIDFTHFKMSGIGMKLNEYLRGIYTKQDFYDYLERTVGNGGKALYGEEFTNYMTGKEIGDFMLNYNPRYEEMCREASLNGYGDFITVRRAEKLHDNDNIDKRIVYDKGYTSSSLRIEDIHGIDYCLDLDEKNSWTIITKYKNGNPANHGMSLSYAEIEGHSQDWDEILTAPYQKFKRTIIDERNKLIVQEPYEP